MVQTANSADRESLKTFNTESATRLARIARELDMLASCRPVNTGLVHSVFRDTHSLKGAANLLGLTPVERIAHKLEDILDEIRCGTEEPDEKLVMILKSGYARIEQLVKAPHLMRFVDVDSDLAAIERHLAVRRKQLGG